ncbi:metal ABC transporter permease [Ideonella sp.]|jgi:zinc/manganese transport system permease protein|uniref:metal ABC transporter permease n=1 Tax=Ideonella sp. TaxID=1929293 RepID=UPI0037C108D7
MILAEFWFMAPLLALLAGLWALAPLGRQVLLRGVVFIDLAVAQSAAAAALLISVWLDHPETWSTQLAALIGALAAAGLVAWLSRRVPTQREALIGLVYVAAACVAMLSARADPHGRERMAELLAADVLWVTWSQASLLAACAVLVWLLRGRCSRDTWFYPLFALVASVAVPILGLFVVFALLIAPALWWPQGAGRAMLAAGCTLTMGLGISGWLDAPSGVCVALSLAALGLVRGFATGGQAFGDSPSANDQR